MGRGREWTVQNTKTIIKHRITGEITCFVCRLSVMKGTGDKGANYTFLTSCSNYGLVYLM